MLMLVQKLVDLKYYRSFTIIANPCTNSLEVRLTLPHYYRWIVGTHSNSIGFPFFLLIYYFVGRGYYYRFCLIRFCHGCRKTRSVQATYILVPTCIALLLLLWMSILRGNRCSQLKGNEIRELKLLASLDLKYLKHNSLFR